MERLFKVISDRQTGRLCADKYIDIRQDDRQGKEGKFTLAVLAAHPTDVGCAALVWAGGDLVPRGVIDLLRHHDDVLLVFITEGAYRALEPHFTAPAIPHTLHAARELVLA